MESKGWTRQQLLIALRLYCETPFGKLHRQNPEIIYYAKLIGRTPSALAMKLSNIASLDPVITSSGRKGLAKASKADKDLWEEMNADWESLTSEAQAVAEGLIAKIAGEEKTNGPQGFKKETNYFGRDKPTITKTRLGQKFFRKSVLSSYQSQCCISGLTIPSLLVASHIVPWHIDEKNRLNPRNGLCLSVLHDRAFDTGIITITEEMTVRISCYFSSKSDTFFSTTFSGYEGQSISLPEKFLPSQEFLAYHRQHIFERNL